MVKMLRELGTLLTALAGAAAFAACADGPPGDEGERRLGNGIYVPATWQRARNVPGHAIHVVEHGIACAKCHTLGEDTLGEPTPDRCAVCHAAQATIEHARDAAQKRLGPAAKADCTTCHVFTTEAARPDGSVFPTADDCRRCHGAGGEARHAEVHAASDCLECHRPHSDRRPTPHACTECHEAITSRHAIEGKHPTAVCTTCHDEMHARAVDARTRCVPCHEGAEPPTPAVPATALFETGHRECVGCHRPHGESSPEATAPCADCHEGVPTLGGGRVKEHRACQSCHAPHDVRRSPDQACARCHTGVHPDHPKHGETGTCVGCHDPHPAGGRTHTSARACSSCHQTAGSDTGFHGDVACQKCHTPHAFVGNVAGAALCTSCHAGPVSQVSHNRGHGDCTQCHRGLPHRPARLGTGCEACHGTVAAAAHTGHSECRRCHEPHSGSVTTDCRSCHTEPHRTAPKGHQRCTVCHDQHSTAPTLAACGGCHAAEAATPHGRMDTDCKSCHRPHGPKGVATPPSCQSCHAREKLPGLHATGRHDRCLDCHSRHGERKDASRATCLTCHQDRTDHQPTAPSCGSCHLFGVAR